jgi:hypothetical protein
MSDGSSSVRREPVDAMLGAIPLRLPPFTAIDDAILQIEARIDRLERRIRRVAWFVAAHILISTVIAGILVLGR